MGAQVGRSGFFVVVLPHLLIESDASGGGRLRGAQDNPAIGPGDIPYCIAMSGRVNQY
jgi:hypothetical protein